MAQVAALACLLLAAPAAAGEHRVVLPQLHRSSLVSIPMRQYAGDCWQHHRMHLALNSQGSKVGADIPGAGMDPKNLEPFETVFKDGFFKVDCIKDYLYSFGDKFGDGKFKYRMAKVANISIVHYTDIVEKEDRETMTQDVCFKFCRTVPDMLVFGLFNGRDCYCAPYYKAMASDSSSCDVPCEGDASQMCGGESKSSVFSMHECGDTAKQLGEATAKASGIEETLDESVGGLRAAGEGMQASADELQASLGKIGDVASSALMQKAKVTAGEALKAAAAGAKVKDSLAESIEESQGMKDKDFGSLDNAAKAEDLTATMEKLTVDAEDSVEAIAGLMRQVSPSGLFETEGEDHGKQYYPLMYFVDKAYEGVPTTCSGKPVSKPMVKVTVDECAYACDFEVHDCIGFQYFPGGGDALPSLCYMFSTFKEATYYTDCSEEGRFLQRRAAAGAGARGALAKRGETPMSCMVKFSKFDGLSLKPDGSGKCPHCLKELTKSARCPVGLDAE